MRPAIQDSATLGLSTTVGGGAPTEDVRTPEMGYPYPSERNRPIDDLHRLNRSLSLIDADMRAIRLASLTGIPVHVLLRRRP